MSKYTDLYEELAVKVGYKKLAELVLLERSANQRYWARGIRNALEPLAPEQARKPGQIRRVLSVAEVMEEQANEYDPS